MLCSSPKVAISSISPVKSAGNSVAYVHKIFPSLSLIVHATDSFTYESLKLSATGSNIGKPSLYFVYSFQVESSRNSRPPRFQVILLSTALKIGADTLAVKTGLTPIPLVLIAGLI